MEILEEDVIKILVAVLCGGILGLEREYQNKSAGFRTIILITLGATLFTIVSQRMGGSDDRIAANIITGIGFIGAGVIFKGSFDVKGLTTAAVIWISAAIGMTIGIAHHLLAVSLSILVLIILSLFGKIEAIIDRKRISKSFKVVFRTRNLENITALDDLLSKHRIKVIQKSVSRKQDQLGLDIEVSGRKDDISEFTSDLLNHPEITDV